MAIYLDYNEMYNKQCMRFGFESGGYNQQYTFSFLNVLMNDLGLSCMGLKIEHISKMQLKLGKMMLNHQRMGNGIPYLQTKPNMEGNTSRILES
jgi:hypothetical protein